MMHQLKIATYNNYILDVQVLTKATVVVVS